MSARIEVQLACRSPRLATKAELRTWAAEVLEGHDGEHEVTVRVVDEDEGAQLNLTYRQREGATNVLSFPFSSPLGDAGPSFGDIAVCAPVIRREAEEQGKSVTAHCAHMVVHGALHLLGYDHGTKREAAQMEAEETSILSRLGFADPYHGESVA